MGAKSSIKLTEGDITTMETDAIVNAANTHLVLGAGVAGAIRKAGGPGIQAECDRIGPIPLGEAAITGAGNLKAKYVIHAAGMEPGGCATAESVRDCAYNSLLRAREKNLNSIAFPAIGAGIAGFPMRDCARIMLRAARDFLAEGKGPQEVWFVLFGRPAYEIFREEYDKMEDA